MKAIAHAQQLEREGDLEWEFERPAGADAATWVLSQGDPDPDDRDRFRHAISKPATDHELDRAWDLINEVDGICDHRIVEPVLVRAVPEGCWMQVWLWVPNVIRHEGDEDDEEDR